MPVISVVKDGEARTLTVTARFDAPIARVWQVWSDPRQLERWRGPPSIPRRCWSTIWRRAARSATS